MVTSSWVGPTPPVVKTRSHRPEKRAAVRPMSSRSSGITMTRSTSTPRSRNSRHRNVELMSWVFPERTSLPMMMMPAVFDMPSDHSMPSGRKEEEPQRTEGLGSRFGNPTCNGYNDAPARRSDWPKA